MRSTSGQATIDYVAVVGVLAIVFGLAVGAAPAGAAGIVNAVTGQIRHALCVVGGGPCADPRSKPCTVASTRDLHHFAVKVVVVRIDHDRSVLREVSYEAGVRGLAEAGIGTAWLEGLSGTTVGVRRDRQTGATTLTLNAGAAGWAVVSTALGGPAGAADRVTTLGLTLDRDGRPTELALSAGGTLAAGAALPLAFRRALLGAKGNASLGDIDGRRWELNARLSLHDPVVAAAWKRFRGHPTSSDAIRVLGEAVRDRAYLDVRVFRIGSTASGGAVGVAAGVRVGGEYDHIVDEARLIGATSRPPAGLWERRYDCVPA
jgi:hypothetical protein